MGVLLVLGLMGINFVLYLLLNHMIVVDSIVVSLFSTVILYFLFKPHSAICLLIFLALLVTLYFLQKTKIGFWIVCALMSLGWANVAGSIAYSASGKDKVWKYVIFGLAFVIMVALHVISWRKHFGDNSFVVTNVVEHHVYPPNQGTNGLSSAEKYDCSLDPKTGNVQNLATGEASNIFD